MSPHDPTEDSDPTEMLPAREWVGATAPGDTLAPGTRTVSYNHLSHLTLLFAALLADNFV